MATWRRITGVAGLAAGAVAAGAGAVVAAERIVIGRTQVLRSTAAPERLGELRGQPLTVLADGGVSLHVEIDEPPAVAKLNGQGAPPQPLTLIFCHGYTLNQDCWHFQRAALREHRLVFWDLRDHGRSGRSAAGAASIDRLGADLDLISAVLRHPAREPEWRSGRSHRAFLASLDEFEAAFVEISERLSEFVHPDLTLPRSSYPAHTSPRPVTLS